MNAMSRERLVPLDVTVGATTPTYQVSVGYGLRLPPDVLRQDVHGSTIHMVSSRPPYSKEV